MSRRRPRQIAIRLRPSKSRNSSVMLANLIERTCHDAQCQYTMTFDAKAAKVAGMRLVS
ncbi:hypothetical protein BCEP4_300010 [Burkholderia cepacia]|nr:hypothetical protein BCEP4_300010 [Burkholderia cepacia]